MSRVTKIPATLNRFTAAPIDVPAKRKVAAYARVSTDREEQLTSYSAQVGYYTDYIQRREDWEFVKVYADEGISGCSTKRREGFCQMVEDALAGKIGLIITKSVSRFARNTVDSLTTIRRLKENGVECYFEKENIWTFDSKGELLLTIMSSLAQEESRSISEAVIWGHRRRFEEGKVSVAYSHFLGYDKGADGKFAINEEQAKTVRLIYHLFLEGKTPHGIAKELTARKLPTPCGNVLWHPSTVKSILTNEKYKGDALLQKRYTESFLTKKLKVNQGEVPQYYVEDDHTAIIPPEVFDTVQREMASRKSGTGRYSGVDKLSTKIKCGQCGGSYGPKVWHSTDKYRRVVYQCRHKYERGCTTPHLGEQQIKSLFVAAVNQLVTEKDEIIGNIELVRDTLCDTSELESKAQVISDELTALTVLLENCIAENARYAQDQAEYQKRYDGITAKYEQAKQQLDETQRSIADRKGEREVLAGFVEALRGQGLITEFDERLWESLLESAVVYEGKAGVQFVFKDGTIK